MNWRHYSKALQSASGKVFIDWWLWCLQMNWHHYSKALQCVNGKVFIDLMTLMLTNELTSLF